MYLKNFMIIQTQNVLINQAGICQFSFKNSDVSVYSKKDEKSLKKHLTKEEVFGNIDEHC